MRFLGQVTELSFIRAAAEALDGWCEAVLAMRGRNGARGNCFKFDANMLPDALFRKELLGCSRARELRVEVCVACTAACGVRGHRQPSAYSPNALTDAIFEK